MDAVALVIVIIGLLAGLAAGWFLGSRTAAAVRQERDTLIPDQYAEIQRPDIVRATWIDEMANTGKGSSAA